MAATIGSTLTMFGAMRDAMTEQLFHMTYGSPLLQALVGLDPKSVEGRKPEQEVLREQDQAARRAELDDRFEKGGAIEAAVRSIAYVRAGDDGTDERSFAVLKELHDAQPPGRPQSMLQLKEVLREQSLLLRLDQERAVAAIPKILPRDPGERARTLRAVQRVVAAQGKLSKEGQRRLERIEQLMGAEDTSAAKTKDADVHA
jgi:hypothetical protein